MYRQASDLLARPLTHNSIHLFRLAVQVYAYDNAYSIFELKPTGVISPVLLGCVISFFTLGASQRNHWPYIFLRSHNNSDNRIKRCSLSSPKSS